MTDRHGKDVKVGDWVFVYVHGEYDFRQVIGIVWSNDAYSPFQERVTFYKNGNGIRFRSDQIVKVEDEEKAEEVLMLLKLENI